MKRILLFLFILLFLLGCGVEDNTPETISCELLAGEFDIGIDRGCFSLNDEYIVGATLVSLSEPEYGDLSQYYSGHYPEYNYELQFEGNSKEYTFKAYVLAEGFEGVPYEVGKFYEFDLRKACGAVMSSGPHNSMFSDEGFTAFREIECE